MLFVIVGRNDNLVYQQELDSSAASSHSSKDSASSHVSQFVLHASLDVVDEKVWESNSTYLKMVDEYAGSKVSAYVTPGHVRLLLLHEKKDDDGIKNFFNDVHELYVKVVLNPFYNINSPIQSATFDERVRAVARKRLDV